MKIQSLQRHRRTALRPRCLQGRVGGTDHRAGAQQLHQTLGGTCCTQQIAIHLAQHRKRTGQQNDIDHGLAQFTGTHAAIAHRQGPLVQAPQQRCTAGQDDETHQHRACQGAAQRCFHGLLGGVHKTCGLTGFSGIALHHGNRVQYLSGQGTGICHAVLTCAGQLANTPPQGEAGPHHQDQ